MTDTVDLLRRGYDGLAHGDVQPLLGLMDDDIEWFEAEHVPYWPGHAFMGPHAVLDGVLARLPQDFDGFRIDMTRMIGLGDTVLVEARYRATVKATGKPLDAQVAHVWDFRDGKAVRWQQYTDTWQFAEATGRVPPS